MPIHLGWGLFEPRKVQGVGVSLFIEFLRFWRFRTERSEEF